MFETDDEHLPHKLAYQKPDMRMKGLLIGVQGPFIEYNLVFWPQKPRGFISLGSWEAFDANFFHAASEDTSHS